MKTQPTPAAAKAASRKPARGAKLLRAVSDLEAPITVTVSGRTAAVIRFAAHLNDRSPEEEAIECIRSDALNDLENGFGHTHNSAEAWLAEDTATALEVRGGRKVQ